jgi:hypothetical protein
MANSRFSAGSDTSQALKIENWQLKIGQWLSARGRLPLASGWPAINLSP